MTAGASLSRQNEGDARRARTAAAGAARDERPRRRSGHRAEEPGAPRNRRGTLRRGGARRAGGGRRRPSRAGRRASRDRGRAADACLCVSIQPQPGRGPAGGRERVPHRSRGLRDTPKHPRIIEGRLLYGRALGEAGEPARGVEQLAQAVSDAAEVFGPSSRMVGFFSLPLAEFQLETGRSPRRSKTAARRSTSSRNTRSRSPSDTRPPSISAGPRSSRRDGRTTRCPT